MQEFARDAARAASEPDGVLRLLCRRVAEAAALDGAVAYVARDDGLEVVAVSRCGDRAVGPDVTHGSPTAAMAAARDAGAPLAVRSEITVPLFGADGCVGYVVGRRADGTTDLDGAARDLLDTLTAVGGALLARDEAGARLGRLGELKSQFIALASHELRGPVGVIQGLSSTLHTRGADLDPAQVATLQKALHEQSEHLSHLVHQLLDLSRLDADAIRIERERFAVRPRVEDIVRLVARERAEHVEVDVPDDLEAVADPRAVERIVSNLVVNALRYGSPPVRVSARQYDRHFRLVVEDRGPGIDSSFVPRLFERFARGSEDLDGTGLGLAIAQSYAHAHGGELLYEAAKPRGARFELVLPRPQEG